jgi:hypothetical protein
VAVKKGHARVVFDEVAYAEDTVGSGRTGAGVLRSTRIRLERDGISVSSLRRCEGEGSDGTRLPACFKVYLPEPDGKFGMVLALTSDKQGLGLHYLAFGMRHHPKGSHAPTVYEIADRRLNR